MLQPTFLPSPCGVSQAGDGDTLGLPIETCKWEIICKKQQTHPYRGLSYQKSGRSAQLNLSVLKKQNKTKHFSSLTRGAPLWSFDWTTKKNNFKKKKKRERTAFDTNKIWKHSKCFSLGIKYFISLCNVASMGIHFGLREKSEDFLAILVLGEKL